jgi:cobalt-zinc-cadmium efflux system outer membrane protein
MSPRGLLWALGLVLLGGCCQPVPDHTEDVVNNLAARVRDLEPIPPAVTPPTMPPAGPASRVQLSLETDPGNEGPRPAAVKRPLQLAGAVQMDATLPPPRKEPFAVPRELPGSQAPLITWPETKPEREQALRELYPPLSALPPDPQFAPGPEGRPLTLSDLQSLAAVKNPAIKVAAAAVEAAKGAVRQAGAYTNPSVFWEADTVGTAGAGYQGAGFDQPLKGASKIKLQKAMATSDLRNAEVALRRAQSDLATQVRSNYFGVLVAAENVKVSRALARFAEQIYLLQVDLLDKGFAAPYEPMQLRALVLQARSSLVQAQNQYQASWKQLAAAVGLPFMPPTELAGRVDMPVPRFEYDKALARVLESHTDVLTAQNNAQKARYNLELAKVTPFPDYDLHVLIQKDYTTPPHLLVYSAAFTFPVPLWDQNKGNIVQAENLLIQSNLSPRQTQLQLITTLADAYNRYDTARQQVQLALRQIADQVRAYRALYDRRQRQPAQVAFADIVTAQQTLATYIAAYVTALGAQWTAVVDMAHLLQTEDLFGMSPTEPMAPVPDLQDLLSVPRCNPGAAPPGPCPPAPVGAAHPGSLPTAQQAEAPPGPGTAAPATPSGP